MNVIRIKASPHQLVPDHTDAGRQYEHLSTQLEIQLEDELDGAMQYHLLFKLPSGRRLITEKLAPSSGVLTFPLPRGLTEEHGPIEVQLSVYEETESGWQLKYTPIITPLLHISKSIPSPLDEIPEDVSKGLLVDMTQLANNAEQSAQAAESSAKRVEEALGDVGDIEKALDEIITLQENLIGGASE